MHEQQFELCFFFWSVIFVSDITNYIIAILNGYIKWEWLSEFMTMKIRKLNHDEVTQKITKITEERTNSVKLNEKWSKKGIKWIFIIQLQLDSEHVKYELK